MRQRVGAYAIALRTYDGVEQILLTRVSNRGFPPGHWGLPGGGVDHGEAPVDALRRELLEETSLMATDPHLVDVHDLHTVSVGRADEFEDYHGIHLIFRIGVAGDGDPHVVEVDGTTDAVAWVDVERAGECGPLLPVVEHVLGRLDALR